MAAGEEQEIPETIDWSQARYLDYAYVTVEVTPPPAGGGPTRMALRTITDGGQEIDAVTLERTAVPV